MLNWISFSCLITGSACLGVGGMLIAAAILPIEGFFCILLGLIWLYLSEAALKGLRLTKIKQSIFQRLKSNRPLRKA